MISDLRSRAVALSCAVALLSVPVAVAASQAKLQRVPPGTRATLQLRGWLSSEDAEVGDTFEATLTHDISVEGRVVVPSGAIFVGRVAEVHRAGKLSKGGKLTLVVDKLVSGHGESAPAPGTVTGFQDGKELKGKGNKGKKAAIGGGIGGVLGAIVGGTAGLLAGLAIGAGGAIVAGRGKNVKLPEGTLLDVKFDREVTVTWTWRLQDQS